MTFKDRFAAAEKLAENLLQYKNKKNVVVLAIPRGGLQTGSILAKKLHLPLDIILTKKIGHPLDSEYAIGAVSLHGTQLNTVEDVPADYIDEEVKRIQALLKERYALYRKGKKAIDLKNKIIIITDDGAATGDTFLVAVAFLKTQNPKKIIVALPVAAPSAIEKIKKEVDEVLCLVTDPEFIAVGQYYENFEQVSDAEAINLLQNAQL